MSKILSIIVPSYNMEAYLPKCLGSLVVDDKELLQKLDVIVVNDGSKDRTSEIAHEFEAKYPGVFRVIDKANGHYGSCINAALPVAQGVYVKVLDADDWFDTGEFAGYLTALDRMGRDYDLVLTDFDVVDKDGAVRSHVSAAKLADKCAPLQMHAVTYRQQMLRDMAYRQTEGVAYTDTEWVFSPVAVARRVGCISRTVYKYLVGREGQSVSSSVVRKNIDDMRVVFDSMASEYARLNADLPQLQAEYLRKCLTRMATLIYNTYIFTCDYPSVSAQLTEFDSMVAKQLPFCYTDTDGLTINRYAKIHYIRRWRTAGCLRRLWVVALRVYLRLITLKNVCQRELRAQRLKRLLGVKRK